MQQALDLISSGLAVAAAKTLEEFVEEQPDNPEARKLMSRVYIIFNDQERAANFSRKLHDAVRPSGCLLHLRQLNLGT